MLPYGVAFKLVGVLGLITLPVCCWAFGRLARFRWPMPELFAFAGLAFALDESFSIYGGNLKSTMAGEFSFSIALVLGILGLGLLAAGLRTGKYRVWAAVVIAGRLRVARHRADLRRRRGGDRSGRVARSHAARVRRHASGITALLLIMWWTGRSCSTTRS